MVRDGGDAAAVVAVVMQCCTSTPQETKNCWATK
jgi:hypothetical protein